MNFWLTFAQYTAIIVTILITVTGLLQSAVQIFQLAVAFGVLLRRPPAERMGLIWTHYAHVTSPVAFLVPAYNEERTIVDSVQSLLAMNYPKVELIVVNDGSTDETLKALDEIFGLVAIERDYDNALPHKPIRGIFRSARDQRLIVIDKENGGKADALNCAVNLARSPLVCSIDADSLLEPDSILRAVKPFVDDPYRTVAVGATVRVANGCRIAHGRVIEVGLARSFLAKLQTIEYLRSFLMARLTWSELGLLTIVSGAFGVFSRQAVIEVGGYSTNTVGEDFELVVRMHRYMRERGREYRIEFIPEPVCWTEVPETLSTLGRQRARWHRGAMETFFTHRTMLGNRRYGRMGLIGFPLMLLIDVISPVAEVFGYVLIPLLWALGLLSVEYFIAFLALSFSFGLAVSTGAFVLQDMELRRFTRIRDLIALFVAAILENLGYRQLNNFWRLRGLWEYVRGHQHWGQMERAGFQR